MYKSQRFVGGRQNYCCWTFVTRGRIFCKWHWTGFVACFACYTGSRLALFIALFLACKDRSITDSDLFIYTQTIIHTKSEIGVPGSNPEPCALLNSLSHKSWKNYFSLHSYSLLCLLNLVCFQSRRMKTMNVNPRIN